MGQQVNFYMGPEDEREFVQFARASGASVLPYYASDKRFEPLDVVPVVEAAKNFDHLWIYHPSVGQLPAPKWDAESERWYLGYFAPLVEFDRSITREGIVSRGRLNLQTAWYDPTNRVTFQHPPEQKSLYEKLARWIRRRYEKKQIGTIRGFWVYGAPQAIRLHGDGFHFMMAPLRRAFCEWCGAAISPTFVPRGPI